MHEIITLQLGQQANYLATHFWNTQEFYFTYSADTSSPINHDILWRPGLAADGTTETFMPRTVIYDLKGGFGSLHAINPLYEAPNPENLPPQPLWSAGGAPTVHAAPPIAPSAYTQSLDAGRAPPRLTPEGVRYWSDFSRVYYHPRSVVQLHEYELGSTLAPFERFAAGEELFAELDREHDVLDRDLRLFAEEADQMQGIQMVTGTDDAWGGFAGRYLERVRDEFGKKEVWVWGVESEGGKMGREKRLLRLANKARNLVEAYKQASIVIPLAAPRTLPGTVSLDHTSPWHASALLASAMESITLPSRLKDRANRDTLSGMADTLNAMGKQTIAGLQMSFTSPSSSPSENHDPHQRKNNKLTEDELTEGVTLDIKFTPTDQLDPSRRNGFHSIKTPKVFSQLVALRGYPASEDVDGVTEMEMEQEAHDFRRRRRNPSEPITRSYTSDLRFPLLDSFPQIFRQESGSPLTETMDITTSLSTDSSISDRLKLLRTTVSRSIGLEDRETIGNDLAEMADEYHEGWSSGSDSGDDD
ncbi:tubulin domain-containing protein [Cercophora newfieldiana]|uniref:Tubulin domain-containing protein n=1 Tax=Cercophora newfieldiana TaxID=92897 RepID=A0AA39Y835_9PEZI|nr:tubulin domain-containing protein [Cercophora newfieldiana]